MSHKEVEVQVTKVIQVDEGIADLVRTLNSIEGISTCSCCQGDGAKTCDPLSMTDLSEEERKDAYVTFKADGSFSFRASTPRRVAHELALILWERVPLRDWGLKIDLGSGSPFGNSSAVVTLTLNPRLIDFVTERLKLRKGFLEGAQDSSDDLTTEEGQQAFNRGVPLVSSMIGRLFEHLDICSTCSPQVACERARRTYKCYVGLQQTLIKHGVSYVMEGFPSMFFPALLEGLQDDLKLELPHHQIDVPTGGEKEKNQ